MTTSNWLMAGAAAALLIAIFVWWWLPRWRSIKQYIKLCSTCGYLPDPPSEAALRRMRRLSRLLLWIQVGKVHVIGEENLNPPGPMIIAPNHGHSVDPAPFSLLLKEPARYMAARGVFTFGGGLGALMAAPCGAFAADLTPGKGGPAREAAVKVLSTGQRLVMFPEGWAWMTGKVGEFKKGAVRIAKEASLKLGAPTYIVPVFMKYGGHPGDWILKFPPPAQYLIVLLMFPFYRRGLTMVIGKPICSNDLPDDAAKATEVLRNTVMSLDPSVKPVLSALRRLV